MNSRPDPEYRALRTSSARPGPGRWPLPAGYLALCLATLLITACEKKEAPRQAPPPEVEVTDVVQRNVPIYQEWVAQLNGPSMRTLLPRCRDTC